MADWVPWCGHACVRGCKARWPDCRAWCGCAPPWGGDPAGIFAEGHIPNAVQAVFNRIPVPDDECEQFLLYCGQLELETARLAPTLLAEMEKHGIPTSRYNVPKWEDSPEGFHRLLASMFRHSPPHGIGELGIAGGPGIARPARPRRCDQGDALRRWLPRPGPVEPATKWRFKTASILHAVSEETQ